MIVHVSHAQQPPCPSRSRQATEPMHRRALLDRLFAERVSNPQRHPRSRYPMILDPCDAAGIVAQHRRLRVRRPFRGGEVHSAALPRAVLGPAPAICVSVQTPRYAKTLPRPHRKVCAADQSWSAKLWQICWLAAPRVRAALAVPCRDRERIRDDWRAIRGESGVLPSIA